MHHSYENTDDHFTSTERIGKPRREQVICQDDIVNLIIALETSKDVNEILEDTHIFDIR